MTKLLTTAIVGFTYQMCNEHSVEDEDLVDKVDKSDFTFIKEHPDKNNQELKDKVYNRAYAQYMLDNKKELEETKNENDYKDTELVENAKRHAKNEVNEIFKDVECIDTQAMSLEQEKRCILQANQEKEIIERFLNNMFKFNPNTHAVNSFNENTKNADPERSSINNDGSSLFNNVPNDTFNRFQMYYDVNYEKIREAVMYLYTEKPDIEVAINVYDTFDTLEQSQEFIEKNKNKVITNIYTLTNTKWNLLGSFKENRDKMNFYNKNTVILESIIKQQEEDAKTGKELLSKRVKKLKAKNVKRYGKDHPNFVKYKKQHLDGIYDTTITKITEEDDELVVESVVEVADTGAKVDEDGVPEDALEIKVTSINAATNEVKHTKIYTKSQEPKTE